jgi:hypothetical protein
MINVDVPSPTIFYSSYGYVEVDKNELNSDSIIVSFNKKTHNLTGKINVKY